MPTLLLSKKDVQNLVNIREVITVVETAFKEWTEGKGVMPSKLYLTVKDGDFRAKIHPVAGENADAQRRAIFADLRNNWTRRHYLPFFALFL